MYISAKHGLFINTIYDVQPYADSIGACMSVPSFTAYSAPPKNHSTVHTLIERSSVLLLHSFAHSLFLFFKNRPLEKEM